LNDNVLTSKSLKSQAKNLKKYHNTLVMFSFEKVLTSDDIMNS